MEEGRPEYWNMEHCVDDILTSHFNTIFLAIVHRPLLKLDEDSYSSHGNSALARKNTNADHGGKELGHFLVCRRIMRCKFINSFIYVYFE